MGFCNRVVGNQGKVNAARLLPSGGGRLRATTGQMADLACKMFCRLMQIKDLVAYLVAIALKGATFCNVLPDAVLPYKRLTKIQKARSVVAFATQNKDATRGL